MVGRLWDSLMLAALGPHGILGGRSSTTPNIELVLRDGTAEAVGEW